MDHNQVTALLADIVNLPLLNNEAFRVLRTIDRDVLPMLLQLAKEDQVLDRLLDAFFTKVGRYIFLEIEPSEKDAIIHRLMHEILANPDIFIEVSIYILSNPLKEWWELAVSVIATIGYPRNAAAIPVLIGHACVGNDVAEYISIQTLLLLNPRALVPYLLDALFYDGKSEKYLYVGVSDMVWLLLDKRVKQAVVTPCGPLIVLHIEKIVARGVVSVDKLLQVLEKIGADCAYYALPTLPELLTHLDSGDVKTRIHRLIATFPRENVEPYALFLARPEFIKKVDA